MRGTQLLTNGLGGMLLFGVTAAMAGLAAGAQELPERDAQAFLQPVVRVQFVQPSGERQEPASLEQDQRCRVLSELQARMEAAQAGHQAALQVVQEQLQNKLAGLQAELSGKLTRRLASLQESVPVQIFTATGGWLGVTIAEVTPEKAKELRLPAERGVLVTAVTDDSPAAKAGLKVNDVITEYNGQRVEGTTQFRRLLQETPPGRTVQLTVWRDGRAQQISAELGGREDQIRRQFRIVEPRFEFRGFPEGEFFAAIDPWRTPVLGIVAEDLTGQLGEYFGAPEGEGVLVREVRKGTPAEKAGLKAGDVIIRVDGQRVRSLGELRNELRKKREENSVQLDVLRRGQQLSVKVAIEPPPSRDQIRPGRRIVL
jgi:serine protease Do